MKIAILGTSGSGKSTLAKRLGETYGLPVLHMDTVHFLPGWVERPFAEEEAIVWQQNKGRVRESSAPGCEEKIDAEFVRWILHDGRTAKKRAEMERIGEEYPEKYVMIRNQRELDGFLEFIESKDSRAGGAG